MNRREFVRLMGLASGASLLDSCSLDRKSEKLIPYLVPPDDGVIPGVATHYKTTCMECPAGCGSSAKVIDGQVGKLEGIDGHPINDGALCMRGQASLSRLYHPNRLKSPLRKQGNDFQEITWDEAYQSIAEGLGRGSESVFLSGRTSGTLSEVIDDFCKTASVERLPEFELYSHAAIREANKILFGRHEIPSYRVEDADFLLTLGADVFETFVSPVSHAAQFGRAKKNSKLKDWYHVEPHASLTGLKAKERFVIAPGGENHLLAYLLHRISSANVAGDRHISGMIQALPNLSDRAAAEKTGLTVEQLHQIDKHLQSASNPLVIAGGVSTMNGSGHVTAVLAGLLQWAGGMVGKTVNFTHAEDFAHVGSLNDMEALAKRLSSGGVGVIFLSRLDLPGGPSLGVLDNLKSAGMRVGLGEFMNDTLSQCDIVLPLSDTLESWGDLEPKRGLVNIVQPAINPLYDTRSEGDVWLNLGRHLRGESAGATYQEVLIDKWRRTLGASDTERLLRDGFVRSSAGAAAANLDRSAVSSFLASVTLSESTGDPVLYVTPSLRNYDGRSKDMALMSEIPDPITTVSWGGWVSVSRATASELGLEDTHEVTLSVDGWSTDLPVKIQPGLAKGIMTVERGAVIGAPMGIEKNSGELITSFSGATISKTGKKVALPILSGSQSQHDRNVVPKAGHDDHGHHGEGSTLYPENPYVDYRWGMAIDLDLCTGCSACAAACYVENNVPVVGAADHLMGRELSWIRIEPFYEEANGHDEADFQPMLCQHCSNAPCESVCPVYATYHSEEGLNAQIYNRCVGTRYCANNCPYKVRRFNWFDHERPGEMNPTRNPELSVRGRGIMEKCSFCVQRIRSARDTAKDEDRKIQDGEVTPACAQTCPTNAIVFGNLLDKDSEVKKWSESDRAHRVFELLGTEPAVHYLKSKWKKKDHA